MTEIDRKVEALTASIRELALELKDKHDIPEDRITAIEAEIAAKSAALDELIAEKKEREVDAKLSALEDRIRDFTRDSAKTKAAAILAGVDAGPKVKSVGRYSEDNFLAALKDVRRGDPDAQTFVKAVLGTSDATGQAIAPNNFVAGLVEQIGLSNPYRGLFSFEQVSGGFAVDIPYEVTAITAALLQGAYGSNKDVRDFSFGQATATLYTIAQIADVGNQLLRQSNGAAERSARRRLGQSIGMKEAQFITAGSGSSEPLGFFQALAAFGNIAAFQTTLSTEPRAATLGRGISALEARGFPSTNLVIVMNPTDYWELNVEGLGTSYAGGWAIDPAAGASATPPVNTVWGVPIVRDPNWPAAQAGKALIIDRSQVEVYTGQSYRIDVSSEGGNRFDQNVTGFRAEEEFGFNAEPYVRTGRVQVVNGL